MAGNELFNALIILYCYVCFLIFTSTILFAWRIVWSLASLTTT